MEKFAYCGLVAVTWAHELSSYMTMSMSRKGLAISHLQCTWDSFFLVHTSAVSGIIYYP